MDYDLYTIEVPEYTLIRKFELSLICFLCGVMFHCLLSTCKFLRELSPFIHLYFFFPSLAFSIWLFFQLYKNRNDRVIVYKDKPGILIRNAIRERNLSSLKLMIENSPIGSKILEVPDGRGRLPVGYCAYDWPRDYSKGDLEILEYLVANSPSGINSLWYRGEPIPEDFQPSIEKLPGTIIKKWICFSSNYEIILWLLDKFPFLAEAIPKPPSGREYYNPERSRDKPYPECYLRVFSNNPIFRRKVLEGHGSFNKLYLEFYQATIIHEELRKECRATIELCHYLSNSTESLPFVVCNLLFQQTEMLTNRFSFRYAK